MPINQMKSESNQSWMDLYREHPEQAWLNFIGIYDELIRQVIHRLVNDYDERMELYTYTLEQLKCNDYQKLTRYFDKARIFNFESWIVVIVRNCCMDWFRINNGRTRLLKSIKELSPLDQLIFKYLFQEGYSYLLVAELLNNRHEQSISVEELCNRIEKINNVLQQKTRWKLANEWREILPKFSLESFEEGDLKNLKRDLSVEKDPNPEDQLLQNSSFEKFQTILDKLSAEQKLIIHLHFYKNLTLQEIARILKMKNLWQVHRKLHKALKVVQKKLRDENIELSDLDFS